MAILPTNAICPYCIRRVIEHCPTNPACDWFACQCGAFGPKEDFRQMVREQIEKK